MSEKKLEFTNSKAVAELYDYAASLFRPPLFPEHEEAGEAAGDAAAPAAPEARNAGTGARMLPHD